MPREFLVSYKSFRSPGEVEFSSVSDISQHHERRVSLVRSR